MKYILVLLILFSVIPDFAIAKSARRADRLNPFGFNLARRGNPKQISNAKFGIIMADEVEYPQNVNIDTIEEQNIQLESFDEDDYKKMKYMPQLYGDFRIRFKTEGIEEDFYIYNRLRLGYDKFIAGFVMRRYHDAPSLNLSNTGRYHLIKYYAQAEDILYLEKMVIGSYNLQFAQGLVFYYPFNEIVRPIKIKAKGVQPDTGTNPNAYFKGIAAQGKKDKFEYAFFLSDNLLDASLNDDGTVKTGLDSIRDNLGYLQTQGDIQRHDTLEEKLYGGRGAYAISEYLRFGVTGYSAEYNPEINPPSDSGYYLFRGDKNSVYGFDINTQINSLNFVGEYANSIGYGKAWILQPMFELGTHTLWCAVYSYDPDFYNQHSSAMTLDEPDKDINEQGVIAGTNSSFNHLRINWYAGQARFPQPYKSIGSNHLRKIYIDCKYRINSSWELSFREKDKWYNKEEEINSISNDIFTHWRKTTLQCDWNASSQLKYSVRWSNREDFLKTAGQAGKGNLFLAYVQYKWEKKITCEARVIFFNTDGGIYVNEIEPLWPCSYTGTYWQTQGEGLRYYCAVNMKFNDNNSVWIKYENTHKYGSDSDHVVRAQYDVKW